MMSSRWVGCRFRPTLTVSSPYACSRRPKSMIMVSEYRTMRLVPTRAATLALLFAASLAIYAWKAGEPALRTDERPLAGQAAAIAASGRDSSGRFLPLYVRASDEIWLQPIPV